MVAGESIERSAPAGPDPMPAQDPVVLSDPVRWVDEHGDYLYAFAMVRLRDPMEAQDVVQEAFLAALKTRHTFAGKSAERGWLLGILKHKISDAFRRARRVISFTDLGFYEDEEAGSFVTGGLHRGAWIHQLGPKEWSPRPGEDLDREEFRQALRRCLAKLPKPVCQVFLLREVDECETRDICATLEITENNLWVMLHRARMALRRCLERSWFAR